MKGRCGGGLKNCAFRINDLDDQGVGSSVDVWQEKVRAGRFTHADAIHEESQSMPAQEKRFDGNLHVDVAGVVAKRCVHGWRDHHQRAIGNELLLFTTFFDNPGNAVSG